MDERSVRKDAVVNSFWYFVAKVIEKAGAVIFTIILARFLLPEGFGVYNLAMSVVLIATGILNYSIDNTSMRYVSWAVGKNNKKKSSSYFIYLLKMKFVLILIFSILLLILAYPLSVFVFKKSFLFPILFISGFYMFVLAFESSYDVLFYVFKVVKGKAIKEIFKQTLRILIVLSIFFIIAKAYYIIGVIVGLILTNIAILVFSLLYFRRFAHFISNKEKIKISKGEKKKILKFFYCLLGTGVAGLTFSYIDIIMLGIFLPETRYIGIYSASISLVLGITGMLGFASVFLPIFIKCKKNKLGELFNKVLKYSLMIALPIIFGIAAISNYIVFIIYGKEYLESSVLLTLTSFLIAEGAVGGIASAIFYTKEKPGSITKIAVFVLILDIILNVILINAFLNVSQLWASIGAAIATIISRYASLISLIVVMKKKFKIKINYVNLVKPLLSSVIMFISLWMLNKFIIKDINLFLGLLEIILGAAIYIFCMLIFKGISKEELSILKGVY